MVLSDPYGSTVPGPGQAVPFTASLRPPPDAPPPTGTVVFTLSGPGATTPATVCRVAVADEQAVCPVTFPTGGVAYYVAAYFDPGTGPGGATTYVPSQAAERVVVSS